MRIGRRLGIDFGVSRHGLALCDPEGLLATPLLTLPAKDAVASIAALVLEYEIVEVVIGLPKHLDGREGDSVYLVRSFADELRGINHDVSIRLVDERRSTLMAASQLRASGKNARNSKGLIDQGAAVIILQSALDAELAGRTVGEVVA